MAVEEGVGRCHILELKPLQAIDSSSMYYVTVLKQSMFWTVTCVSPIQPTVVLKRKLAGIAAFGP